MTIKEIEQTERIKTDQDIHCHILSVTLCVNITVFQTEPEGETRPGVTLHSIPPLSVGTGNVHMVATNTPPAASSPPPPLPPPPLGLANPTLGADGGSYRGLSVNG